MSLTGVTFAAKQLCRDSDEPVLHWMEGEELHLQIAQVAGAWLTTSALLREGIHEESSHIFQA